MEQKFFATCLIRQGDHYLMLEKEKGRHIGAWLFPGGKIQDDESPLDTIKREILHDTGLKLNQVELRGIVHFMMQEQPTDPVLARTNLYVFYCDNYEGILQSSNKGRLEWIHKDNLWNRKVGRNDEIFVEHMLKNKSITFAKFFHNKQRERIRFEIE